MSHHIQAIWQIRAVEIGVVTKGGWSDSATAFRVVQETERRYLGHSANNILILLVNTRTR